MTNSQIRQLFKDRVASKFHPEDAAVWMQHYDRLTQQYGIDRALDALLSAAQKAQTLLQSHASLPLSPRGNAIKEQLEIANKKTVETNPRKRLIAAIESFNKNLEKCGVQIRNKAGELVDAISPAELEAVKVQIPQTIAAKSVVYSAWASSGWKDKLTTGLVVEVR